MMWKVLYVWDHYYLMQGLKDSKTSEKLHMLAVTVDLNSRMTLVCPCLKMARKISIISSRLRQRLGG